MANACLRYTRSFENRARRKWCEEGSWSNSGMSLRKGPTRPGQPLRLNGKRRLWICSMKGLKRTPLPNLIGC